MDVFSTLLSMDPSSIKKVTIIATAVELAATGVVAVASATASGMASISRVRETIAEIDKLEETLEQKCLEA